MPAVKPAGQRDIDISFWVAIKFGAGFVLGASAIGIVVWVVLLVLVVIGLSLPGQGTGG